MAALCLAVTGVVLWPTTPPDLAVGKRLQTSGVLAAWHKGDLIVLVRHEERCDRSSNQCQGPEDGLTLPGSQSSAALGQAFKALGMDNSDVLVSPTTRTAQTSRFMFGTTRLSTGTLAICGHTMSEEILTRKTAGRNLLLITHSACISDFERSLGYPHADATEYGSSLFVEVTASGTLKALGIMHARDWTSALKQLKRLEPLYRPPE